MKSFIVMLVVLVASAFAQAQFVEEVVEAPTSRPGVRETRFQLPGTKEIVGIGEINASWPENTPLTFNIKDSGYSLEGADQIVRQVTVNGSITEADKEKKWFEHRFVLRTFDRVNDATQVVMAAWRYETKTAWTGEIPLFKNLPTRNEKGEQISPFSNPITQIPKDIASRKWNGCLEVLEYKVVRGDWQVRVSRAIHERNGVNTLFVHAAVVVVTKIDGAYKAALKLPRPGPTEEKAPDWWTKPFDPSQFGPQFKPWDVTVSDWAKFNCKIRKGEEGKKIDVDILPVIPTGSVKLREKLPKVAVKVEGGKVTLTIDHPAMKPETVEVSEVSGEDAKIWAAMFPTTK